MRDVKLIDRLMPMSILSLADDFNICGAWIAAVNVHVPFTSREWAHKKTTYGALRKPTSVYRRSEAVIR